MPGTQSTSEVIEARTRSTVVGRELELAAVDWLLEPGRGQAALVLSGEPGIGKTTIVRAALERAASASLQVFVARPTAGEMDLPYASLGDLLAGVRNEALGALAAPQRDAIGSALGRQESDDSVGKHALSRGVFELLRVQGAAGDLLLVIDDVQWLDRPTEAALSFALRRLDSVPVRVLLARRGETASVAELPLGLAEWPSARQVEIGPLSATDLGALIREGLDEQWSRPRLEWLSEISGGNPMFALELVRRGLHGHELPALQSLPAALRDRLGQLDPAAQEILTGMAACLRPTPDILFASGFDATSLKAALSAGIVELAEGRLSFTHPLLGAAAYELTLPDERRAVHLRLAAAASDPVEQGHHVSRSAIAPDDDAAATLERAAGQAANLGDHGGAAAFLLRAAELAADPESEVANGRRLRAASELYLAGDIEAAVDVCRNLRSRLPPGPLRAQVRKLQSYCLTGSAMSYGEAIHELRAGLDEALGDDELMAELHIDIAEIACGMCLLGEAVSHARQAIELAEAIGAVDASTAALCGLGFAESMLGFGVSSAARDAFARWDGTIAGAASPRMNLACALLASTDFDEAAALFAAELEAARDSGLEPIEVVARGHLAETQLRMGHWAEALANARLALEHARQAAEPQVVVGVSYSVAMTQALLGQHDVARAVSSAALPRAVATEDFWFTLSHRAVLGFVALTEDDAQEAVDVLEPAWRLMLARGLGDLSLFPVAQNLAEALALLGRTDEAFAIADRLRACPVGEQAWCRTMACRSTALVASARGDHASARSAMGEAVRAGAELPEPFEQARTLQLSGRVERNARNWGAARRSFTEALERFDALGAARWSEKTAAEIARLPGRRKADGDSLSAREREVAELVAAGLANKEVAARLYVSVRTVESNLSKVYAKLQVRSRTELASRLARMSVDSHN